MASFDCVVVGGGIMGLWSAVSLAKRNKKVLLVEQFSRLHGQGSSHGDGRIFRLAYSDEAYIHMMRFALPLWKELESTTDKKLVFHTGGIDFGPVGCDGMSKVKNSLTTAGVSFESLTASQVNERFPQYCLSEETEAIFQADGGILHADNCRLALWSLIETLGVEIQYGSTIESIQVINDEKVILKTSHGELDAKSVVIAAGAWTSKLGKMVDVHLPLTPTLEHVYYFPVQSSETHIEDIHKVKHMPFFVSHTPNQVGAAIDIGYYGLPQMDIRGVKMSAHHVGPVIDPDTRQLDTSSRDLIQRCLESTKYFAAYNFRFLAYEPETQVSCIYTSTPDHHFIIDSHPKHKNIVFACGGSGHGFKMGPAIGEAAADLLTGEKRTPFSLEMFSLCRFKPRSRL